MISIILPVYNEEDYIKSNTIKIMKEVEKLGNKYEILIVEESTDKTPQIASELSKKYKAIRHFHSSKRLGKGRAIEYGIKKARGSKIVFMDIDISVDLSSLRPLLDKLDYYDVVVGSRYHPQSRTKRTLLRLILGRGYSILPRRILGINASDFQCGFKGFRKASARNSIKYTTSTGVFWDTEILFIAKNLGYKIGEIPINWVEKKTRSTQISVKTIYTFALSNIKLFFCGILRSKRYGHL